jgi:ubiquitin carboxyl-terminal hydrolase 48
MNRRKPKLGQELDGSQARQLHDVIQRTGTLPVDDILELFNARQQACAADAAAKACKHKGSSPNCFAGLVPQPTSFRRKGLWQKDSAALVSLGPDPSAGRRQVSAAVVLRCARPAGAAGCTPAAVV